MTATPARMIHNATAMIREGGAHEGATAERRQAAVRAAIRWGFAMGPQKSCLRVRLAEKALR